MGNIITGLRNGKIDEIDEDDVDYDLPNTDSFFSANINLIPMPNNVQAPRSFYGARFFNQALPVVNREAPLVQNLKSGSDESYDDHFGEFAGAIRASSDGVIKDATPDRIVLQAADGTERAHDLYRNFTFNRKSVSGNSVITIRRAGGKFWRGIIAEYEWHRGDETPCVLPDGAPAWREVTAYLKHAVTNQLLRVEMESGRSVIVTEDHSLVTLDEQFHLSPIEPLDAVVGITRCPWSFIPETNDGGSEADFDLGVLYGLYLAEGSLDHRQKTITIAVEPSARIAEVRELVLRAVGGICHDSCKNASFTNHKLYENLKSLCGCGAGQKFIDARILQSNRKFREGIVAGYMSGDGCLWSDSNGAIQLCGVSTSRRLRDDLVFLLASLGIATTKFDAPRQHLNPSWNDAYGFRVLSGHIGRLKTWFFYQDRVKKLSARLANKYRASSFEHIPVYGKPMRKTLYRALGAKPSPRVYQTSVISAVAKRNVIQAQGQVGMIARSTVLWDTITSIIPCDAEPWVYDLEVAEAQNFMVDDGLIVHNSSVSQQPRVKTGDQVKKGDRLSTSDYTDDKGTLAMGINARVALAPFKGWSMDDATVISEGFAKRLSSEMTHSKQQDFDEETKGGLNHFVSLFPSVYTKDQMANFDETGVVKPGMILRRGDPFILATAPRVMTSRDANVGKLSRTLQHTRKNASHIWDHEDDGVVTDVARTKNGSKVVIKSTSPTRVGDKIVLRTGQKGIVAKIIPDDRMLRGIDGKPMEMLLNPMGLPCFDSETEILTTRGWIPVAEVSRTDQVATLNRRTFCMEFQTPTEVMHIPYKGKMYRFCNQQLDMCVTPNHRQFSAPRGTSASYKWSSVADLSAPAEFELLEAREIFGKPRRYLKAARWDGYDPGVIHVSAAPASKTGPKPKGFTFRSDHWAEFMGWFLAEGYTSRSQDKKRGGYQYSTVICQSKTANPEKYTRIRDLLRSMGIKAHLDDTEVTIRNKSMYERLAVFGKCRDKFIPREILDMPTRLLRLFLDALLKGDGNSYTNLLTGHVNTISYTTASRHLAGGVQEVAAKLGIAVNVRRESRRGDQACYYMSLSKTSPFKWVNFMEPEDGESKRYHKLEKWSEYDGHVHCVTVPNGVVFVRRDGKAVFSGNSRVNNSLVFELALGKVARKMGQPIKLPAFNAEGTSQHQIVTDILTKHGINLEEEVFDPETNRKLERPVSVGEGYVMKLVHVGEDKLSARGVAGYDAEQQPQRGGGAGGGAKRVSGLEQGAFLSSGAYATQRENATLRGTRSDEYWRQVRAGETPPEPGAPFVWHKFLALLNGAGMHARNMGKGRLRLGPMTDKILAEQDPVELKNGELVDLDNLEPIAGGLFDPALVGANRWAYVKLPKPLPNPAFENSIRVLLKMTKRQFDGVLAGKIHIGPDGKIIEAQG